VLASKGEKVAYAELVVHGFVPERTSLVGRTPESRDRDHAGLFRGAAGQDLPTLAGLGDATRCAAPLQGPTNARALVASGLRGACFGGHRTTLSAQLELAHAFGEGVGRPVE
jgi:hypothetical protein